MDQRLRFTRNIIILAVCIILCNQFIHLCHLYKQENIQYTYRQNKLIEEVIYEFSMLSTDTENTGLSFNADKNKLTYIIKGQRISYQLNAKDNIRQITERSRYDIRDSQSWKLKNFYSYLQIKQDSTRTRNLSMQFAIQDSTGKITDSYPQNVKTLSFSPKYLDTLGYISGDVIYATYNYPVWLFIQTAIWQIILTILITILFVFCIINLYLSFRKEKKSGEYREQFIHNLVHDLKRPVENQIKLGYVLHDTQESEQADLLEQSETQLKEMLQSINRMLLQSTDAHGLRLNPKEFNLREMLETLTHPNRWRVEEGKEFRIQAPFLASHDTITGDSDFLYAVFQNFIDNSLKYSGQQVNIVITCKDVDDRHVQVEVKDNGFGISPEALKHIFERYHRGDHQGDKKIKGHGQGLYYARVIINAHRGHITVNSTPGEGTTITITLPKTVKKKKR